MNIRLLLMVLLGSFISIAHADALFWKEGSFLISGDYLLMRLQQDGISYGTKYDNTQFTASAFDYQEDVLVFPFKFESGFRITAGWEEPCTLWGLKATFDFLQGHSKGSSSTITVNSNLIPTYGNPANIPLISNSNQHLQASWKAYFNQLDLVVDRKLASFRNLGLNLILGVRLASIQQWLKSEYEISGSDFGQSGSQKDLLKSRFKGVGVVTGFETRWFLWEGFNLYGSLKGALLYSKSTFSLHADELQSLEGTLYPFIHYNRSYNLGIKSALDLGVGIEYSRSFCNNTYLLCVHTGWEQHIWFNQNNFTNALFTPQISDQNNRPWSGDFNYYGWVFGVDLIF